MAVETGRIWAAADGIGGRLKVGLGRLMPEGSTLRQTAQKLRPHIVFGSLARRIFLFNLVGLAVLIFGITSILWDRAWLIETRLKGLRSQGELVAAAIAAKARVKSDDGIVFDPTQLPSVMGDGLLLAPGEQPTSLELPIRPERVTPILRRLMRPTDTRARVYSRDGTFIADSRSRLTLGRASDGLQSRPAAEPLDLRLTRQVVEFITWCRSWLSTSTVPLYKDVGRGNGSQFPEFIAALAGQPVEIVLINQRGQTIVSGAVPIVRSGRVQGVLILQTHPGEIDDLIVNHLSRVGEISLLAILVTLLSSLAMARSIVWPLGRLADAADRVRQNIGAAKSLPDFSNRSDEIGQLAGAFSDMTEALYKRIEASEKFAADVSHELKNPITATRSTAEALTYAKTDEMRDELVAMMKNDLNRLNRLIADISNSSRLDAEMALQEGELFDTGEMLPIIVSGFNDLYSSDSRSVAVQIEPQPDNPLAYTVFGHSSRIAQVLTNLIENAISFSPDNGVVTVFARRAGSEVELVVEDEGLGIPEDRRKMIFERFYTDRPETEEKFGKNSGLGLSISREIIIAHRGRIWVENRRGDDTQPTATHSATQRPETTGARFIIRLPAAQTRKRKASGRGTRWR